ncbi:MAG: capsular biosynthesis protein [Bacilli bacterium]|nr:capsular biosynthesis protein [Bacilli bacterium]
MKDIHSHLLYGIDDGSKSIEESIPLLKELEKQGVTDLMLTPHYIENSKYNCNNEDKQKIFEELSKRAEEEKINIRLYLGNEVFFTPNMINLIEKKEIQTLNNSRYILFEFPLNNIYQNTSEIINEIVSKGYIPVLAHPERYEYFQKHPNAIKEYLRSGLLLQGNITSLFGIYGKTAEKTLKYFIKNKWISFIGSDTHHNIYFKGKKVEKKLLRLTKDKEYTKDLIEENFNKVIQNIDIGMIR